MLNGRERTRHKWGEMTTDIVRSRYQNQSKSFRIRFLISCAALLAPAPPAQPLARSQPTNLGVKAAVKPTLCEKEIILNKTIEACSAEFLIFVNDTPICSCTSHSVQSQARLRKPHPAAARPAWQFTSSTTGILFNEYHVRREGIN